MADRRKNANENDEVHESKTLDDTNRDRVVDRMAVVFAEAGVSFDPILAWPEGHWTATENLLKSNESYLFSKIKNLEIISISSIDIYWNVC